MNKMACRSMFLIFLFLYCAVSYAADIAGQDQGALGTASNFIYNFLVVIVARILAVIVLIGGCIAATNSKWGWAIGCFIACVILGFLPKIIEFLFSLGAK